MTGPLIDAVETGQVDFSVGIDGWFCSRLVLSQISLTNIGDKTLVTFYVADR